MNGGGNCSVHVARNNRLNAMLASLGVVVPANTFLDTLYWARATSTPAIKALLPC